MSNHFKLAAIAIFFGIVSTGCSMIEPGTTRVVVQRYGDKAGFENAEEINSGSYKCSWDEACYDINTSIKNYSYTSDTTEGSSNNQQLRFQTAEGVDLLVNMGVTYRVAGPAKFVSSYRKDDDNFAQQELYSAVRDVLTTTGSRYSLTDLFNMTGTARNKGSKSGMEVFQDQVLTNLKQRLSSRGVEILELSFLNGIDPPGPLKAQLEATQRAKAETAKAEEEVKRARARQQVALIEAKTAAIEAQQLTPMLLRSRELDLLEKKWNGAYPSTLIINGNGQSPIPIIGLSNK